MKVNRDPSVAFNVRGVRKQLVLGLSFIADFIHNDGSTIVVLAGYGADGAALAEAIRNLFPCWDSRVSVSNRAGGTFALMEKWEAEGVSKAHYVCLTLPLTAV